MTPAPSRLLARLDESIAQAGDTVEGDCLRAERAIYLARLGEIGEAKEVVASLRSRYSKRPHLAATAWIGLADGLAQYFDNLSDVGAWDRVVRAQALAQAGGLRRLEGLCSAWLAHLDFMRFRPSSMRANVDRALALADRDDHGTRARAAMVVAYALHFSGSPDRAKAWYLHAHRFATSEGDLLTLSALQHNIASFRLANARHAQYRPGLGLHDETQVLFAADSNRQLDDFLGATALKFLTPMLRAQVLVLLDRCEEALALFAAELESALLQGGQRWKGLYLAERAWCELRTGDQQQAGETALDAAEAIDPAGLPDDLAPAHSRLAMVFTELAHPELASKQQELAHAAWIAYEDAQKQMAEAFRTIVEPE